MKKLFLIAALVLSSTAAFAAHPGEVDTRPGMFPNHSNVVWNGVKDVNPGAGAGMVDTRPGMYPNHTTIPVGLHWDGYAPFDRGSKYGGDDVRPY